MYTHVIKVYFHFTQFFITFNITFGKYSRFIASESSNFLHPYFSPYRKKKKNIWEQEYYNDNEIGFQI